MAPASAARPGLLIGPTGSPRPVVRVVRILRVVQLPVAQRAGRLGFWPVTRKPVVDLAVQGRGSGTGTPRSYARL